MMSVASLSIRKKILFSMLALSLVPILILSGIAARNTYAVMREQLMSDRRVNCDWLKERIAADVQSTMKLFYEFEINQAIRTDIVRWCTRNAELDYAARWRIISLMNSILNTNTYIDEMKLYNYQKNLVLSARRSGADLSEVQEELGVWGSLQSSKQTNLMYANSKNEILAAHQLYRFEDNLPIALLVFHIRPSYFNEMLARFTTTAEESICVLNHQHRVIAAHPDESRADKLPDVNHLYRQMGIAGSRDVFWEGDFWFYRSVGQDVLTLWLRVPNTTLIQALIPTVFSGLFVAVIAILASILLSLLFSKAISQPVRQLTKEMETLVFSDFSGQTPVKRKDEIGILQLSFQQMVRRNQDLINLEYNSKLAARSAQLRALQAQINPHFMYNTLQLIGGIAIKRQVPEVYQITLALGNLLRYALDMESDNTTLEEEVRYLNNYITIQNQRSGGRVRFHLDIAPETQACLVPKLLLQPLVENSFEHGFCQKSGEWHVSIKSEIVNEKDLQIKVLDNGAGLTPQRLQEMRELLNQDAAGALSEQTCIGLFNVHMRIRLIYPMPGYGVSIDSKPNHLTKVQVKLKAVYQEGQTDDVQSSNH